MDLLNAFTAAFAVAINHDMFTLVASRGNNASTIGNDTFSIPKFLDRTYIPLYIRWKELGEMNEIKIIWQV